jgi:hypothetical protein
MRTRTLEPAFQCGRGTRWSGRVCRFRIQGDGRSRNSNGDPVALPAGKVPAFVSRQSIARATQRNATQRSLRLLCDGGVGKISQGGRELYVGEGGAPVSQWSARGCWSVRCCFSKADLSFLRAWWRLSCAPLGAETKTNFKSLMF